MTIARRDVEAILVAHEMDPSRRELYVEGRRDTVFLRWLLDATMHRDAQIVEIDEIESPLELMANNRGRLAHFAGKVVGHSADIRCFADADYDRLLGRTVLVNITLTDTRDLEGYLIRVDCFEKLLRLGLNDKDSDPRVFLRELCGVCRETGLIRITSEKFGYNLPFKGLDLGRCVSTDRIRVSCDAARYLRTLFQNAGISLSQLDEFQRRLAGVSEEFRETSDADIVHGKDFMAVLARVLGKWKVEGDGASTKMLWTSFERQMSEEYSNLSDILRYLQGR